jgi:hypothetical protein
MSGERRGRGTDDERRRASIDAPGRALAVVARPGLLSHQRVSFQEYKEI